MELAELSVEFKVEAEVSGGSLSIDFQRIS